MKKQKRNLSLEKIKIARLTKGISSIMGGAYNPHRHSNDCPATATTTDPTTGYIPDSSIECLPPESKEVSA